MSKLTEAHGRLCRAASWIARNLSSGAGADVEIDGAVRHYHRTDRYRNVTVSSDDEAIAAEIGRRLTEFGKDLKGVRIFVDDVALDMKGRHVVGFSIWPG